MIWQGLSEEVIFKQPPERWWEFIGIINKFLVSGLNMKQQRDIKTDGNENMCFIVNSI